MNQISIMSDNELVDELVKHCPSSGKEVLRKDFDANILRYRRTLESIPAGAKKLSLLDVGARLYTASIYCNQLDYKKVSIGAKWKTTYTGDDILSTIPNGDRIGVSYYDAEVDIFPYPDESYDVVVCSEILEHLAIDPMHMMDQINRVTRTGGLAVISTPNAASFAAIKRLLAGKHPYSWSSYNGTSTDRHNREYTVNELEKLIEASGFNVISTETFSAHPFSRRDRLLSKYISLLDIVRGRPGLDLDRLGDTSLVAAKKTSAVRDRFPRWLYYDAMKGR